MYTFEWAFAAIPAIYSGGHTAKLGRANYAINMFHTNKESMLFTAWLFNFNRQGKYKRTPMARLQRITSQI
ncbi:MAG: hypothetical protein M1591_04390 [Deltaproteobacteria bacterium]|nr:hypothetical protein [Deltaproteobacteria bacterium]